MKILTESGWKETIPLEEAPRFSEVYQKALRVAHTRGYNSAHVQIDNPYNRVKQPAQHSSFEAGRKKGQENHQINRMTGKEELGESKAAHDVAVKKLIKQMKVKPDPKRTWSGLDQGYHKTYMTFPNNTWGSVVTDKRGRHTVSSGRSMFHVVKEAFEPKYNYDKRITSKKHGGNDSHSFAVFVDGQPAVTGLTRREIAYHKRLVHKKLTGKDPERISEEVSNDPISNMAHHALEYSLAARDENGKLRPKEHADQIRSFHNKEYFKNLQHHFKATGIKGELPKPEHRDLGKFKVRPGNEDDISTVVIHHITPWPKQVNEAEE